MAAAVLELFPNTTLGVGPVIEHGFFYDFNPPKPFNAQDLLRIEKRMREIIKRNEPFRREEMKLDDAISFFRERKQEFKVQLLTDLKTKGTTAVHADESQDVDVKKPEVASIYWTGKFVDLCRGPHVATANELGIFKLTKISGAYWRGDQNNKQLQRVYGLAFNTQAELDAHLKMLEEAEKRDHRKLGAELNLFITSELVGPGMPLYTPEGASILFRIKEFSRELRAGIGYREVQTPQMNKAELFKLSGHYDQYREDMFRVVSNYTQEEYFLKPMNCPQHTQLYAAGLRSYRELPIKYQDFAMLYRDEKPGQLAGLTRLRSFSQDDGHCFCTEEQIEKEFALLLGAIKTAMKVYGMEYFIRLSLRDEKKKASYLGSDEVWEKAQALLESLLKKLKVTYVRAEGEAAFYGPKMDLIAKDSIGREWQLSTIQLDLNMPKRFGLEYVAEDGTRKTPVMIHAALVGSPERFMGVLIEHYAGAFPTWLAPLQAAIVPVGKEFDKVSQKLAGMLREAGIRVDVYDSKERVGHNIRRAITQKVPYMLVVGDKEKSLKKLTVRVRGQQTEKQMTVKQFIDRVTKEIETKR
jgi:threonyl-tRNA synthetase